MKKSKNIIGLSLATFIGLATIGGVILSTNNETLTNVEAIGKIYEVVISHNAIGNQKSNLPNLRNDLDNTFMDEITLEEGGKLSLQYDKVDKPVYDQNINFVALNVGDSISNPYLDIENFNRLGSILDITVTYTPRYPSSNDRFLSVDYGWDEDVKVKDYLVKDVNIYSGEAYKFDNLHPNYFKLINCTENNVINISEIIIHYQCQPGVNPHSANAYTEGLQFSAKEGSKVGSVSGYTGNSKVVTIPKLAQTKKGGKFVTIEEIGIRAFENNIMIEKVILPDSIKKICANAFYGCYGLENINLPASVSDLNQGAFTGCSSLRKLDTSHVCYFGDECLNNMIVLESIDFSSATTIDHGILKKTNNIKNATLSKTLDHVPDNLFQYKTQLESIHIPSCVKRIGLSAFEDSGLTAVTFEENSQLNQIDANAFKSCGNLKTFNMPKSVERIEANAFASCSALNDMFISKNVNYIGSSAFDRANAEMIIKIDQDKAPDTWSSEWKFGFKGTVSFNETPIDGTEYKATFEKVSDYVIMTKYIGGDADAYEIPNEITQNNKTYKVKKVEPNAFSNVNIDYIRVKKLTDGTSIKFLDNAFNNCGPITFIKEADTIINPNAINNDANPEVLVEDDSFPLLIDSKEAGDALYTYINHTLLKLHVNPTFKGEILKINVPCSHFRPNIFVKSEIPSSAKVIWLLSDAEIKKQFDTNSFNIDLPIVCSDLYLFNNAKYDLDWDGGYGFNVIPGVQSKEELYAEANGMHCTFSNGYINGNTAGYTLLGVDDSLLKGTSLVIPSEPLLIFGGNFTLQTIGGCLGYSETIINLTIPTNIETILNNFAKGFPNLKTIHYQGDETQWNNITKDTQVEEFLKTVTVSFEGQ